jgi:undecaprenyl-diphosphatase
MSRLAAIPSPIHPLCDKLMPPNITLFAAQHLVVVDAILAAVVAGSLLYRRHHGAVVCWTVTVVTMLGISLALFRLFDALIFDPRPFAVSHFQPLLPHTANNGFPSGYALLAAAIVAAIFFANKRWTVPFVILAFLIGWARVGVGIHHAVDVAGSWGIVTLASLIAFVIGPVVTAILLPSIPTSWTAEGFRLHRGLEE